MSGSFIYTVLSIVVFWTAVHLLNLFLIECRLTSALYAKFLSINGLSVSTLQIKWFTVRCNRLFIKISGCWPDFFRWWFNLGVVFGIVGQCASIFLLIYTLVDFFRNKPVTQQILVPVLPGVNLPSNQTFYYFLALLISGLLHELGHAVAASREQVRVNGFGVFLMFIFPGAYVDLCSDHLMVISPIRQLRIFCAGVWHNFVIVVVCILALLVHPYMVSALFYHNVHVTGVLKNSPLESKLEVGSIITNVGNCDVKSALGYFECLFKIETQQSPMGYCMNEDDIKLLATSIVDQPDQCCRLNETMSNFCFSWLKSDNMAQYACLPARFVTEQKPVCSVNHDCLSLESSTVTSLCVKPLTDNSTKLIPIRTSQSSNSILYAGSIKELILSVSIDEFIPRASFIPKFLNLKLQLFLKYMVAFSGAIGLLNLVPCFALDGQYILASALSINKNSREFVESNNSESQRPVLYVIMMLLGTTLLGLNIIVSFAALAYSKVSALF